MRCNPRASQLSHKILFLWVVGALAVATAAEAITSTPTPSRTPTRTPGPDDCCQCNLAGQPACTMPLEGGCPSGCAFLLNALCASDGSCVPFSPTPTPTATLTPTPRPNCIVLIPNGPSLTKRNTAFGCIDNWQCAITDDGDDSYVFLLGTSAGGTEAWDLYSMTDIAARPGPVIEVTVRARSRAVGSTHPGSANVIIHLDNIVTAESAFYPLPASYSEIVRTYPKNPVHGGLPWTWDDVNALEVGVQHLAFMNGSVRTTSVSAEVCWAEATPTPTLIPTGPTSSVTPTVSPTPSASPRSCTCQPCDPGSCAEVDFETRAVGLCGPCLPPTEYGGDCGGDAQLTIDEIVGLVGIGLGEAEVCAFSAGDTNHDCQITVDEIVGAVGNALDRCSEVRRCGGFAGTSCPAGEWCEHPSGACRVADIAGECRAIPAACAEILLPVCGCDRRTYDNDCERTRAGVARAHLGACEG